MPLKSNVFWQNSPSKKIFALYTNKAYMIVRKIFISFLDSDKKYANKIRLWAKRGKCADHQRVITMVADEKKYSSVHPQPTLDRKIKYADLIIVLIGENTATHPWTEHCRHIDIENNVCHFMRIPYTMGGLPTEPNTLKQIAFNPNAIKKLFRLLPVKMEVKSAFEQTPPRHESKRLVRASQQQYRQNNENYQPQRQYRQWNNENYQPQRQYRQWNNENYQPQRQYRQQNNENYQQRQHDDGYQQQRQYRQQNNENYQQRQHDDGYQQQRQYRQQNNENYQQRQHNDGYQQQRQYRQQNNENYQQRQYDDGYQQQRQYRQQNEGNYHHPFPQAIREETQGRMEYNHDHRNYKQTPSHNENHHYRRYRDEEQQHYPTQENYIQQDIPPYNSEHDELNPQQQQQPTTQGRNQHRRNGGYQRHHHGTGGGYQYPRPDSGQHQNVGNYQRQKQYQNAPPHKQYDKRQLPINKDEQAQDKNKHDDTP